MKCKMASAFGNFDYSEISIKLLLSQENSQAFSYFSLILIVCSKIANLIINSSFIDLGIIGQSLLLVLTLLYKDKKVLKNTEVLRPHCFNLL